MWLSQVESLSQVANHLSLLAVDLYAERASAGMSEDRVEKVEKKDRQPARVGSRRASIMIDAALKKLSRGRKNVARAVDPGPDAASRLCMRCVLPSGSTDHGLSQIGAAESDRIVFARFLETMVCFELKDST